MSDESMAERRVEHYWGMRPGESRDMQNHLFLDAVEYIEVQNELEALYRVDEERRMNRG